MAGALGVVITTDVPMSGQHAQPVYVDDTLPIVGPSRACIVTTGDVPQIGGPAIPVRLAPAGTPAIGPAIPVYVVSGSLGSSVVSNPQLGAATIAALNTTVTNDLSSDGFTWAAIRGACVVDQYGKVVIRVQRYNGNTKLYYFVISNDNGATWVDNAGISGGEGFLAGGAIVYDTTRDCLHGLVMATNPVDGGIIYRRYSITRDGSNNITSIARVTGVSVVLDDAGADNNNGLDFPAIVMPDTNTLLAAWTIRTPAPGGEIRCCKCDITSNADAGGTASNWVHIGVQSTTTIGGAPAVASYTIPFGQTTENGVADFALLQLASGDLRWVYHNGGAPGAYATRRSIKNASVTWNSLSTAVTLTNVQRAGTDTGYALKNQLISQQSENGGVTFVGLATWKSNAAGDTWGVYAIAANDALATSVDVYSAGGAHSYAPTGDCAYDSTAGRIIVTYEQTTTQDGYIGLINPSDLSTAQAFAAFETATDIDIPVIANTRVSGKVLILWRVAGAPPQIGKSARLAWV